MQAIAVDRAGFTHEAIGRYYQNIWYDVLKNLRPFYLSNCTRIADTLFIRVAVDVCASTGFSSMPNMLCSP